MVTRTRTQGGFSNGSCSQSFEQLYKPTNVVSYPASLNWSASAPSSSGTYKSMTDIVTPNFGKKRAEGGIINNPMSSVSEVRSGSVQGGVFILDTASYHDTVLWSGDVLSMLFPLDNLLTDGMDPDELAHMTTLASTSAYAGVEAPAVQGQVFVGELIETLHMLRRPCSGLRDFISNSSKWRRYRNVGGGKAYVKDVSRSARESVHEGVNAAASSWLEARLGWRPFLMDIESILDTLTKGSEADRKSSRAKQEYSVSRTENVTEIVTYGGIPYSVDFSYQYTVTSTFRASILYDFHSDLASNFGFRWADIPSTAWELIPFSFVADWFINVGDFIQALSPKAGTRYLATCGTTKTTSSVTRTPLMVRFNGTAAQSVPTGAHTRTFETFSRVPSLPAPSLTLELDLVRALRRGRGWDALALVTQLFPKGKLPSGIR